MWKIVHMLWSDRVNFITVCSISVLLRRSILHIVCYYSDNCKLFYLRFSLIIGDYVSCLLEQLVEEIHKKCNEQRDLE